MSRRGYLLWWLLSLAIPCVRAQDAPAQDPPNQNQLTQDPASAQSIVALPLPSVSEKFDFFLKETLTPLTLATAVPNAVTSQLLRYAPLYGKHFWHNDAFLKRLGATVADESSRNFFADFVFASALHEDTRYVRRGPSHRMLPRIGYAISRAVVTRTDSGEATFNWANVMGSATSATLSNAYYPPKSRTASIAAVNLGTNIAGAGMTNLLPEFGPDVGRWFRRHLPFSH